MGIAPNNKRLDLYRSTAYTLAAYRVLLTVQRSAGSEQMRQIPLNTLEDLLAASLDPSALRKRFGLPHPLHKFSSNGAVRENAYADAIVEFMNDAAWAEPGTMRRRAAMWFLLESERAFFLACSEAGVDAERLREHLRKVEAGEIIEIE
jgi:hypothetical protein